MLYFYNPWKRQKTFGFRMFSRDIEMEQWTEIGYEEVLLIFNIIYTYMVFIISILFQASWLFVIVLQWVDTLSLIF